METVREVRPDRRSPLFLAAVLIGGLWMFLAGFPAYAAVWWPDHGILENDALHWIGGALVLSCIFGVPVLIQWLMDRRTVWLVNEAGITIRRAGKLRLLPWSEIRWLRVLPFAAIIRAKSKPYTERLNWVSRADTAWLQELSAMRRGRTA